MTSNRNVILGLDTKLTDLSMQGKTGYQVKQQFVNKFVNSEVQLYHEPLK